MVADLVADFFTLFDVFLCFSMFSQFQEIPPIVGFRG